MAHKELITKYAKELTESHQRIVELEVAVADARAELEVAKIGSVTQQGGDNQEVRDLHIELTNEQQSIGKLTGVLQGRRPDNTDVLETETVPHDFRLQKAKERIEELEKTLEDRHTEIETLKRPAGSAQDNVATGIENVEDNALQREVDYSRKRNEELTAECEEVHAENDSRRAATVAQTAELQQAQKKNEELLKRNEDLLKSNMNLKLQAQIAKDKAKSERKRA